MGNVISKTHWLSSISMDTKKKAMKYKTERVCPKYGDVFTDECNGEKGFLLLLNNYTRIKK